ncbi:MAG: hypothetical protein MUF78_05160 [Candidatus Edwardsbacteria bacterium]|nr:hypothetical protein [Candidatus Edwardsbacteria bacterium]
MTPSLHLIALGLRSFGRRVWEPRRGRALQLAVGLCVLSLFLGGGYLLFLRVFTYLGGLESIGRPLLFRLLMSSFLTFSLMLFLSNLVTSLSTLYQSPEIEYLLSTPIPVAELFRYRFYQNLFFSTWATMLLGLPLVLALNHALRAGPWHLLLSLALLVPFVLIPAFLAVLALMAAVRLFPGLTLRQLLSGLLAAMALASGAFFLLGRPGGIWSAAGCWPSPRPSAARCASGSPAATTSPPSPRGSAPAHGGPSAASTAGGRSTGPSRWRARTWCCSCATPPSGPRA